MILWLTKGYIPWNDARFLDYCTDRLLLQRIGGRDRFVHKLLQDHFAAMGSREWEEGCGYEENDGVRTLEIVRLD